MAGRGLAILSGIAAGAEKAAQNIYNINIAKQQLDMKRQEFDVDMKIKKLQLQKAENDPTIDPEVIAANREVLKKQANISKNLLDLQDTSINAAMKQNKQELASAQQKVQSINDVFGTSGLGPVKKTSYTGQAYIKAWSAAKSYLEKNDPEFALLPFEEQQARLNQTADELYQQFQAGGSQNAQPVNQPPVAQPTAAQPAAPGQDIEAIISENMKAYGKTREEVTAALKAKGLM